MKTTKLTPLNYRMPISIAQMFRLNNKRKRGPNKVIKNKRWHQKKYRKSKETQQFKNNY